MTLFAKVSIATVPLHVLCVLAANAQSWNAASDFSEVSNPAGAWTYGWSSGVGRALEAFKFFTEADILSVWYRGGEGFESLPAIAYNGTDEPVLWGGTPESAVAPGVMLMHPGPDDSNAVLRWTCPSDGNFRITANFTGNSSACGPTSSTADVHILVNGVEQFAANVTGYGSSVSANLSLSLSVGDLLDAVVGNGPGDEIGCDHIAAAVTIESECAGVWTQVGSAGPPALNLCQLAFDAARGQIILTGGCCYQWNTYAWNGTFWDLLSTTGPQVSYGQAIAYDTTRETVMHFGGWPQNDETWEWNGRVWNQLSPRVSPPGRDSHALAYDSSRQRLVLFGGLGASYQFPFGDTWEWDGQTWQLVSTSGPAPRSGHTMTYDKLRKRVVLFGGWSYSPYELFGDTWEWDGKEWHLISDSGPAARSDHVMSYDSWRNVVIVAGGQSRGGVLNADTWELADGVWSLASEDAPGRQYAGMAYDSLHKQTVQFGGIPPGTGEPVRETWLWDGELWTNAAANVPDKRYEYGLAYHASQGKVVLFGGYDAYTTKPPYYKLYGDTWLWDGTVWKLASETGPSPRNLAAMVYDSVRDRVVLFGGESASGPEHDTWEWDGAMWSQVVTASAPSPRRSHAMAYDSRRQRTVLSGGRTGGTVHDDTWEFDGSTWLMQSRGAPCEHFDSAMAYDAQLGACILSLGWTGNPQCYPGDTWKWDGEEWTQLMIGGPYDVHLKPMMVYHDARARTLLTVSPSHEPDMETWEWSGTSWMPVEAPGLPVRLGSRMAYDSAHHSVVLFGGFDLWNGQATLDDTWALTVPAIHFVVQPSGIEGCVSDSVTLSTEVGTRVPVLYQWRRDGSALADGPTPNGSVIVGAAGPEIVISGITVADAGMYDCLVMGPECDSVSDGAILTVKLCCPDLNNDREVDGADLGLFLGTWGTCAHCSADFNSDGAVDGADLGLLLGSWGRCVR